MKIKTFCHIYKSELLTSLGLSNLIGASLLNIVATKKAVKIVNEKKEELGRDLTKKEVIQLTWKCYIPGTVALGVGIPCIFVSNSMQVKESAAYAAAYAAAQNTLTTFKQETIKALGEEKTQQIENAVAQKQAEANVPENFSQFVISEDDKQTFYEPLSGRYFKSTWTDICSAKDRLNADAVTNVGEVSLTDWFYELGLDVTDLSDDIGWSVKNKGRNGLIDIALGSMIINNKSICTINYLRGPEPLYY